MKKNKMMRIASVLLVAVLLSTCAISGTYAKYISSAVGSDKATVAKWDVKIGDTPISNTFTFGLFDTINDTLDSNDEKDVADGKIAPGTEGEFKIKLNTASEVTSTYKIDYNVTKNGIPVKFSVDGGTTWTDDLADVPKTTLAMGAQQVEITVMWQWVFEAEAPNTNEADTALGTNPQDIIVEAIITVEQVD